MQNLEDWIGQEVDVVEYVDKGHHQHEIRSEGKLLAVSAHMVLVEVDHVYDDEVATSLGGFKSWFNTMSSTFSKISRDNA